MLFIKIKNLYLPFKGFYINKSIRKILYVFHLKCFKQAINTNIYIKMCSTPLYNTLIYSNKNLYIVHTIKIQTEYRLCFSTVLLVKITCILFVKKCFIQATKYVNIFQLSNSLEYFYLLNNILITFK